MTRAEQKPSRAFITGGTGFVGAAVIRALLEAGIAVRALVRRPVPMLEGLGVEIIEGDLRQPNAWHTSLRGCEVVLHLAAFYSPQPEDAPQLYAVNVGGTQAILRAAANAGVSRVVHTSTIGTIGRPANGGPATEETPFNLWRIASDYVRSKWLGEAVALWWNRRGLPVVIVHPTAPVGAGDWRPTATGQRIVDFLAGRRPDFPTGGMNFCPVQDVAAGHLLATQRGRSGRRYILGHTAGNWDEQTFLTTLAELTGLPIPPAVARPRGRRPLALTANPARAVRELGLPQSDLRVAFAEAVAYYQARQTSGRPSMAAGRS